MVPSLISLARNELKGTTILEALDRSDYLLIRVSS